jgi:hypothetical protein
MGEVGGVEEAAGAVAVGCVVCSDDDGARARTAAATVRRMPFCSHVKQSQINYSIHILILLHPHLPRHESKNFLMITDLTRWRSLSFKPNQRTTFNNDIKNNWLVGLLRVVHQEVFASRC